MNDRDFLEKMHKRVDQLVFWGCVLMLLYASFV